MFLRKRHGTRADELTSLCQELLSHRGDVSGARLAADVIHVYRSLDTPDAEAFFDRLVTKFSPDLTTAHAAAAQTMTVEIQIGMRDDDKPTTAPDDSMQQTAVLPRIR